MEHTPEMIGNINESGYLSGFSRRGFTPEKSLLELVANTMDAFDKLDRAGATVAEKKLVFSVGQEHIRFIDNAFGMNRTALGNMFSMHRENHSADTSRGVSGIGAKPAMSILSGKTHVDLYTRERGSNRGYRVSVPWDLIHSRGVYTGMISVTEMTEEEAQHFYKERSENGMLSAEGQVHGTTIVFRTNPVLRDTIWNNFLSISERETNTENADTDDNIMNPLVNPLDRIGCVFGRDRVTITCDDYERGRKPLPMYDYFGGDENHYYHGISEENIEHWYSPATKTDRFIWINDGIRMEITKDGRGYKKHATNIVTNTNGYIQVGAFTVKVGLRRDNRIFDTNNPKRITAAKIYAEYNEFHIGKNDEFLGSSRLVRNGQIVGLIPPSQKLTNDRGNPESNFCINIMQCDVEFNPVSRQNEEENHQDRVMNIQENKNQHNGDSLPLNFIRLVADIKTKKAKSVWNRIEPLMPPVAPVAPVVPAVMIALGAVVGTPATAATAATPATPAAAALPVAAAVPTEPLASATAAVPTEPLASAAPAEPVAPATSVASAAQDDTPETSEEEYSEEEEAQAPPPPPAVPHDVTGFRRGGVYGHELLEEFSRLQRTINSDQLYEDTPLITLFNMLQRIE